MSTFFGWLNPKRKIKKLIEKSVREGRRGNHAEAVRLRDAAQCLEDYLAAEAVSPRNATSTFDVSDFKSKAIELVKEAVAEDNAHNFEKALQLYLSALDYFSALLKYEKNPVSKAMITEKVRERRARRRPLPSRSDIRCPACCRDSSWSTWRVPKSCSGARRCAPPLCATGADAPRAHV